MKGIRIGEKWQAARTSGIWELEEYYVGRHEGDMRQKAYLTYHASIHDVCRYVVEREILAFMDQEDEDHDSRFFDAKSLAKALEDAVSRLESTVKEVISG